VLEGANRKLQSFAMFCDHGKKLFSGGKAAPGPGAAAPEVRFWVQIAKILALGWLDLLQEHHDVLRFSGKISWPRGK